MQYHVPFLPFPQLFCGFLNHYIGLNDFNYTLLYSLTYYSFVCAYCHMMYMIILDVAIVTCGRTFTIKTNYTISKT